eukprot:CAMPEP_0117440076 /NCGR_PEP_ID=MMETSP0759-20121206/2891_1 /TAXON_ID=63605 /ORGANISM="Percolomonas cosmopolitus, Strain WS" /LENGTH=896 /DNA_ID=CAMNT_0005231805 /DNA_START=105 /DNA_END=2792 /DNA_ORIENTATION=+
MPPAKSNKRKRSSKPISKGKASGNPNKNSSSKNRKNYNKKMGNRSADGPDEGAVGPVDIQQEYTIGEGASSHQEPPRKRHKKNHQKTLNDTSPVVSDDEANYQFDERRAAAYATAMDFFSKVDASFLKYMTQVNLEDPSDNKNQKKSNKKSKKEKREEALLEAKKQRAFEDDVRFENGAEDDDEPEYYSLPIKAPNGTWTRKAIESSLPQLELRTKFDDVLDEKKRTEQVQKQMAMEKERYNADDILDHDNDIIGNNEIMEDSDAEELTEEEQERLKQINKDKMKIMHAQYIQEMSEERKVKRELKMKRTIAKFSTQILTDPSLHVRSLNGLIELCTDPDEFVQKLAILSLCALFQDLAPTYRINIDQYSDEVRMSKQVEEVRHFEVNFLQCYQKYLQLLHSRIKNRNGSPVLRFVCLHSMCELLQSLHHFNFAENIAEVLIKMLDTKDDKLRNKVFDAIRKVFREDLSFEVSAYIVENIALYTKKKKYNIHMEMVACFLSLPLTNMIKDKFIPKEIATSKRKKGKKKFTLAVETQFQKDLREYHNPGANVSAQLKFQTIILRNMIVTYVRLLKSDHKSPLLFTALEGISRFAHLLNVELIYDLLAFIRLLMQSLSEDIPLNTVLQLLTTVSQLTRGLGETINIDMSTTFTQLYDGIIRITTEKQEDPVSPKLLIQAIHTMTFETSQEVPSERAAALVKRLATCACSTQPQLALPMLFMANSVLTKFSRCRDLLSAEVFGMHQYRFDAENPDHANALSTNLWEFYPLMKSVHPHIARLVQRVLSIHSKRYLTQEDLKVLKDLSLEEYDRLVDSYTFTGEFFPMPREPKEDPAGLKFRKRSAYAIHKSSSFFKDYVNAVVDSDEKSRDPWVQKALSLENSNGASVCATEVQKDSNGE